MTDPAATFASTAAVVLSDALAFDPAHATMLGVHDFDELLPDPSADAAEGRLRDVRSALAALDSISIEDIAEPDAIDAEILRTALAAQLVGLTQLREGEWNPMLHNPGGAVHSLLSRDFAPLAQRLSSAASRLGAVPQYLEDARRRLDGPIPQVHAQTAISQFRGTLAVLDAAVPDAARRADTAGERTAAAALARPLAAAREAVLAHLEWLTDVAQRAHGSARLGPERFAAKLWLTLDTPLDAQSVLIRAQADLDRATEQIIAEAARISGAARPDAATVREVLDLLAHDAPTDATILPQAREALRYATEFARDRDLVSIPDEAENPIDVVEMPEIDRGVAVAYCQPPGALEQAPLSTLFAVSPTPAGWSAERVGSFYREYNSHMLHDLAIHEGVPGHALQFAHSRRYRGNTDVRRAYSSGTFVEGWAVYAEQLVADHGYRSDISTHEAAATRMQQLKMRLRTILNAILDIRYHTGELDEAEAMRLMMERGFQEIGEAAGKWRRVQLTATQLSTYYVGYLEVRDLVGDLRRQRPGESERALHDEVLAHGSPPPRHLREALRLAP